MATRHHTRLFFDKPPNDQVSRVTQQTQSQFPEEDTLMIRPSLAKICQGNRPATKLLSALLNFSSAEIDEHTLLIVCNQNDLMAAMIDECSNRTLRDKAIPGYVQFGYLEVEHSNYIVHLSEIQASLDALSITPTPRFDRSPRPSAAVAAWREAVLRRDGYTCQRCGTTAYVVAHHIAAWSMHPQERLKVSNGVTLGKDCHIWVGSKDNTAKAFVRGGRWEGEQ